QRVVGESLLDVAMHKRADAAGRAAARAVQTGHGMEDAARIEVILRWRIRVHDAGANRDRDGGQEHHHDAPPPAFARTGSVSNRKGLSGRGVGRHVTFWMRVWLPS